MKKKELSMFMAKNGDIINMYPQGDPLLLVAKLQDLSRMFAENLDPPKGSDCDPEYKFECKHKCTAHFAVRFWEDGTFSLRWDKTEFADECVDTIARLVKDHNALLHACGEHSGPCSGMLPPKETRI